MKRLFDLICTVLGLSLLWPVVLLLAFLVRDLKGDRHLLMKSKGACPL